MVKTLSELEKEITTYKEYVRMDKECVICPEIDEKKCFQCFKNKIENGQLVFRKVLK